MLSAEYNSIYPANLFAVRQGLISLSLSLWLKGYADYGAYWRSNYEAIDEGEYHYTRDDLMKDVRVIYQEVTMCHLNGI